MNWNTLSVCAKSILPFALLASLVSCGGNSERPEVLSKLRGLGVAMTPLVTQASTSTEARNVELMIYAAVPLDQTVTLKPFKDKPTFNAVLLEESAMAVETIEYQPYSNFKLVSAKARLTVPDSAFFARSGGSGQFRYGFIMSAGAEQEKIIGNVLVFPEGAPQLAWQNPKIDTMIPTEGGAVGRTVNLSAAFTNSNSEELKVGWYATKGEVKNRRARETTWEVDASGAQSLILTVRGRTSRGFAMKIINVNVQ